MSHPKLFNIEACVFDAYGTLFDVSSVTRGARDALGESWQALSDLWRSKQLQYTWLRGELDTRGFDPSSQRGQLDAAVAGFLPDSLLAATYSTPVARPGAGSAALGGPTAAAAIATAAVAPTANVTEGGPGAVPAGRDGTLLGTAAGVGAFLAIGCPLCNKVVLVALGASGAMSIWAPLQPVVGAASLALLAVTVAWRLRRRAAGDLCAVPVRAR